MVLFIVAVLFIIGFGIALGMYKNFRKTHSTHYKYNDSWIIGKTLEEIQERYGEFDLKLDTKKAYYVGAEDYGIDPSYIDFYYYITFKDDIATDVYVDAQPGG